MKGLITMQEKMLYVVRNKETKEIENAKCGHSGKFYSIKGFAQRRCDEYNKYKRDKFEVATFQLIEVAE